ncbi:hypothetical protein KKD52_14900 [Myxococcota bacterium]|nr:hypothetical protein [Myxococcota bacterium]MBU1412749.1 hypothetical protein [Myxococcota bacterium]MBU1511640.1 hypothetical protein [Myxococcota bacterium]
MKSSRLLLLAVVCLCGTGLGCGRKSTTNPPPRIDKPAEAGGNAGAAKVSAPTLRWVSSGDFSGTLLVTDEEFAGPHTFENHFLEGPRGPLLLDASEIEDDAVLEAALTRAIDKNVRNYVLTARQLCRPPEGDEVSHCAPDTMVRISAAGKDGIYLRLKSIEYPFFPDLTELGPGLRADLDSEMNNPGIPEMMLARLENAVNLVHLSLPLTGEVQARTAALGTLVSLERLTLVVAPSYTGDFAFLKSLPKLRSLSVERLPLEEVGFPAGALAVLASLPALEELSMDLPALDASGIAVLARCRSLKALYLRLGQAAAGLLVTVVSLPALERLGLEFEEEVPKDFDLSVLSKVKHLRNLRLSAVEISESQLAPVFGLTALTDLSMDFSVWPDTFDPLKLAALSHLQNLKLGRIELDLPAVLGALKHLKSINFEMLPELCQGYQKAKQAHPRVQFRFEGPDQCE